MGRKDEAYEYLKNAIISNELGPGTPIRESEISENLKISRTPIREALRDLEADGLVISYPFRGTFVADISPYDVQEIFDLRVLMETWAMKRSIKRITEKELDEAERAFREANGDWEKLYRADRMLHGLILQKSGSSRVIGFLETMQAQIDRLRVFGREAVDRQNKSLQEHMEIIEAIRERDCEKSCEVLEKHLKSIENDLIETARYMNTLSLSK